MDKSIVSCYFDSRGRNKQEIAAVIHRPTIIYRHHLALFIYVCGLLSHRAHNHCSRPVIMVNSRQLKHWLHLRLDCNSIAPEQHFPSIIANFPLPSARHEVNRHNYLAACGAIFQTIEYQNKRTGLQMSNFTSLDHCSALRYAYSSNNWPSSCPSVGVDCSYSNDRAKVQAYTEQHRVGSTITASSLLTALSAWEIFNFWGSGKLWYLLIRSS